jgi:hypothetical protein
MPRAKFYQPTLMRVIDSPSNMYYPLPLPKIMVLTWHQSELSFPFPSTSYSLFMQLYYVGVCMK